MKIVPVILSGSSGTRLWPLSRKECPKQVSALIGDNTMLQETILRLEGALQAIGRVAPGIFSVIAGAWSEGYLQMLVIQKNNTSLI